MTPEEPDLAEYPGPDDRPGDPVLFMFPPDDGGETELFARAAALFPEAIAVTLRDGETADAVVGHMARLKAARAIGLGLREGAGRLAALLLACAPGLSDAVLMHPMTPDIAGEGEVPVARRILITAGGLDPVARPEAIGQLAESLEARGATVKVAWHAGGAEIADSEYEAIDAFFTEIRAGLADIATLPVEREQDESGKGRYVVRGPADVTAEMSYRQTGADQLIIDHTEVPDAFRGTGTGMRLLRALMADARDEGRKIIPICPFTAAQFDKHPEWADMLAYRVRTKSS